jgi:hypothetical protein
LNESISTSQYETRDNVLVLTSGLSGSSVVTALLSAAGYFTGDSTYKKKDYDTFENSLLVALNEQLLAYVGYGAEYSERVLSDKLEKIKALATGQDQAFDRQPFSEFVHSLKGHQPWLWKDPRLWATVPFWLEMLSDQPLKIVFVDRNMQQRWISEILRRNIQSYAYLQDYNQRIKAIVSDFANNNNIPLLSIEFDELIQNPEHTIAEVNSFLGTSLQLADLKRIYRLPLYKRPRGLRDLLLAMLIYLKNYSTRLR